MPDHTQDSSAADPPGGKSEHRPLARGSSVGRYLLLEPLGEGGMGVVYKAYDPELDRPIALKLLHTAEASEGASERLLREAQALARLQHPNVIAVYDVGMFGAKVFIAMEYVEGKTLRAWLKQQTRMQREILEVFLAAGEGLAAAHRAGLVHRDFKPDNVMVGNDGRARVLDFGLARTAGGALETSGAAGGPDASISPNEERTVDSRGNTKTGGASRPVAAAPPVPQELPLPSDSGRFSSSLLNSPLTHAGAILGTPRFMAPEQQLADRVDERADQFSFCVSLYWMLYGAFPFIAATQEEMLDAIVTGRIAPPPLGSAVPRRLRQVLVRGLAGNPAARFPSMASLLTALRADPSAARRRWLLSAALVALPAAVLAINGRIKHEESAVCRGAERRLNGVWDASRRAAVEAAFERSGKASAQEWFRIAAANLDGYTTKWIAQRTAACEATRVHREQSEELLDLRMTCLDGRLGEVESLVSALSSGDGESVQEAPRATSRLGALEECADVAALRSVTPRPRDEKQRVQIVVLEKRLADVQAFYNLGKLAAATTSSATLVRDAAALGFAPLLSKAHLWQGRTFADNYDGPHAISAYHSAFAVALRSGEALVLDDAAVRLAQEYVYARNQPEYEAWHDIASAALQRFPSANRRDFLAQVQCISLSQAGKVRLSLQCLQAHAAELQRTHALTDWELTWLGLAAADAGQFVESVDWVRRGVAYSAEHEGKTHPRTLELRAYLVRALVYRGDTDEALREGRDLLQAIQRENLVGTALESKALLYVGMTLRELRKLADAAPALEHAHLETRDTEVKSEAVPALVQLMLQQGRTRQALALAHQALDEERKTLPATHAYVLNDSLALALAQLASGQRSAAVLTLERVLEDTDGADVNPFVVAEIKAELSGALSRRERVRARALAIEARDLYASSGVTKRFRERVRQMDERLASIPPG